jgi:hypothetical protein
MRGVLITGLVLSTIGLLYAATAVADDPPTKHRKDAEAASKEQKPEDTRNAVRRCPWDSDEDYEVRCRLAKRLPEMKFEALRFGEALKHIATLSGVNIVPDWNALEAMGIEKDAEVTLSVRDLSAARLLDLLLDEVTHGQVDLAWGINKGIVQITTKECLGRYTVCVVYDCTDLLRVQEEDLARYADLVFKAMAKSGNNDASLDVEARERLARTVVRESRNELKNELSHAIMLSVDPESWREAGGNVGTVGWVGTQLVVTQTSVAHRAIFDLLENLRSVRAQHPGSTRWP